jgi:hypothetical protein
MMIKRQNHGQFFSTGLRYASAGCNVIDKGMVAFCNVAGEAFIDLVITGVMRNFF